MQGGLRQWGFACRRWDGFLAQDWSAGSPRSVPGCFVPLCHPHIGLLLPTAPNTCKAQCGLCSAQLGHGGNTAGNCGRGRESSWISTNGCFPWLIAQPAFRENILSQSRAYSAFSSLPALFQSVVYQCFRASKIRHIHAEKRKSESVSAALI